MTNCWGSPRFVVEKRAAVNCRKTALYCSFSLHNLPQMRKLKVQMERIENSYSSLVERDVWSFGKGDYAFAARYPPADLRAAEPGFACAAMIARHARNVSPTVHACAMQPCGASGGSPSKISLAVPRPAASTCLNIGSSNDAATSGF